MAVPQKRNEKKTRRRPKQPYALRRGVRLLDNPYIKNGRVLRLEETPNFEEWLEDTEPVDIIEEMVNDPRRILKMAAQYDPDDDIQNDLEELYEDY